MPLVLHVTYVNQLNDIFTGLFRHCPVLHNSWTNSFLLAKAYNKNIQPNHNLVIFRCPDVSLALRLPYE